MRIIYETDIEHTDFIEIILTDKEVSLIREKGIVREFLLDSKYLNIEITTEKNSCH
jgi:hypothetical protein